MIYIASPYSHEAAEVREERVEYAEAFAAHCLKRGVKVYSPIASWHRIAQRYDLPTDFLFWRSLNFEILRHASEIWVLKLDGWEESAGVTAELKLASVLKITKRYFNGDNFQEEI